MRSAQHCRRTIITIILFFRRRREGCGPAEANTVDARYQVASWSGLGSMVIIWGLDGLWAGQAWLLRGHFVDLRQLSPYPSFLASIFGHVRIHLSHYPSTHVAAAAASSRLRPVYRLMTGCLPLLHHEHATLLHGVAASPSPSWTIIHTADETSALAACRHPTK